MSNTSVDWSLLEKLGFSETYCLEKGIEVLSGPVEGDFVASVPLELITPFGPERIAAEKLEMMIDEKKKLFGVSGIEGELWCNPDLSNRIPETPFEILDGRHRYMTAKHEGAPEKIIYYIHATESVGWFLKRLRVDSKGRQDTAIWANLDALETTYRYLCQEIGVDNATLRDVLYCLNGDSMMPGAALAKKIGGQAKADRLLKGVQQELVDFKVGTYQYLIDKLLVRNMIGESNRILLGNGGVTENGIKAASAVINEYPILFNIDENAKDNNYEIIMGWVLRAAANKGGTQAVASHAASAIGMLWRDHDIEFVVAYMNQNDPTKRESIDSLFNLYPADVLLETDSHPQAKVKQVSAKSTLKKKEIKHKKKNKETKAIGHTITLDNEIAALDNSGFTLYFIADGNVMINDSQHTIAKLSQGDIFIPGKVPIYASENTRLIKYELENHQSPEARILHALYVYYSCNSTLTVNELSQITSNPVPLTHAVLEILSRKKLINVESNKIKINDYENYGKLHTLSLLEGHDILGANYVYFTDLSKPLVSDGKQTYLNLFDETGQFYMHDLIGKAGLVYEGGKTPSGAGFSSIDLKDQTVKTIGEIAAMQFRNVSPFSSEKKAVTSMPIIGIGNFREDDLRRVNIDLYELSFSEDLFQPYFIFGDELPHLRLYGSAQPSTSKSLKYLGHKIIHANR